MVGGIAQSMLLHGLKGFCITSKAKIRKRFHRKSRTYQLHRVTNVLHRYVYWKQQQQKTITFTKDAIEKGVRYVMRKNNNHYHIFQEKHGLDVLIKKLGKVVEKISEKKSIHEVFLETFFIDTLKIEVHDRIMNGIPLISTLFVPEHNI